MSAAADCPADTAAQASEVARHDVVITGGGLAGLTLALQLKQRFADLDVLVLERRVHPVPSPRTRSASRRSRSARTTSPRCSV
jgi:Predicted dehydrogenase